jgi:HD-like signal output (HDOD) protein
MSRKETLEFVLKSKNLPTLPIVASRLITLAGQEDTTLTDIAELISKDMALSARILTVSNSAFYSFPQKISSISQSVSILGINAVSSLALSFSFLSMGKGNNKTIFNFKSFWEKSLAGAVAAKLILEQVPDTNTEEIFTSSLLRNPCLYPVGAL